MTGSEGPAADTGSDPGAAEAPFTVLQDPVPLSASALWTLERAFYERVGPRAWTSQGVPSYITTNPFIARAYARVVEAFLRDAARAGRAGDVAGPAAYLVELGAGTGRFAYRFVRHLRDLIERSPWPGRRVTYVLTDFTESNLAFWRSHPQLAPLAAEGWVDFALFDTAAPAPLRLEVAGTELGPGAPADVPWVVVANYFFDSVPQDLFLLEAGHLFEQLVELQLPDGVDPESEDLLARLRLAWDLVPVEEVRYPDASDIEALLTFYRQELSSTSFLVPTEALSTLAWFRQVAASCLVLVGDRGYDRLADLLEHPGLELGIHGGAISLPLNGHALGWVTERVGGQALFPSHGHGSLDISAFVFGLEADEAVETRATYWSDIVEAGPDDFFHLREAVSRATADMGLEELLAVLRLSVFDPDTLRMLLPDAMRLVGEADEAAHPEIERALERVWANHYALPEGYDLAFDLASLYYGMEHWDDALVYLGRSEAEFGPHPSTAYNRGMCLWHLNRLAEASSAMDACLAQDPTFDRARAMRLRISGARSRIETAAPAEKARADDR